MLHHTTKILLTLTLLISFLKAEDIAAPSNLVLTPHSNSVGISWKDNSTNETGFKIYRDGALITTTASNITTYTDSSLKPDTTYNYTIKATTDAPVKAGHEYKNNLGNEGASGELSLSEDIQNDPTVATVKGSLSISQGAAQYSLPLPVPPARAGMEPKISIDYNSQGGNGYLGKGWGIGGLSVVTRCPSTKAIDGESNAIELDDSDKYCLDGQRLISIGNNEYRTQLDNYSKVIAISSSSNHSPESWKVYTKSGLIYEYGAVEDGSDHSSRIIANYKNVDTKYARSQGNINAKQTVISWSISKISDRTKNANAIRFYYKTDKENTEVLIDKVKYSGGEIEFSYNSTVNRHDTISGFLSGSKYNISELLVAIYIKDLNGNTLEEYDLDYTTSSFFTILKKIRHKIGNTYIQPLEISWSDAGYDDSIYTKADDQIFSLKSLAGLVDFNNDGLSNLFPTNSAEVDTFADVNGDGYVDKVLYSFNGDGKISVIYGGENSTGKFEDIASNLASGIDVNTDFTQMSDINGDGKSDLVLFSKTGEMYVSYSAGSSYAAPTRILNVSIVNLKRAETPAYILDLNKDGYPDIIHFDTDKVYVNYNRNGTYQRFEEEVDLGSSFTAHEGWKGLIDDKYDKFPRRFADVNGDGYLDIVGYGSQGVFVSLNTGRGFERAYFASENCGYDKGWKTGEAKRVLADMNNDGYVDIVGFADEKTYIFYGTGKKDKDIGFSLETTIEDFGYKHGWSKDSYRGVYDINNDGTLDVVGYKPNPDGSKNGTLVKYIAANRNLAVTKLTNKKDENIDLYYSSLMVQGRYEKGSPNSNGTLLTPAMQVVSYVAYFDNEIVDEYEYRGYRVNRDRGSLGFDAIKQIHDTGSNEKMQTVTKFYQSFPYIGMANKTYSGLDLAWSSETSKDLINVATYSMLFNKPYQDKKIYDVNNWLTQTNNKLTGISSYTSTNISNDGHGNTLNSTTASYKENTQDYYKTITRTTYSDNQADWIIGRATKIEVKHSAPNSTDIVKTSTFEYDPTTGLLTKESIEPTQEKTLSKTYTYDDYGNKISESVSGYKLLSGLTTTYEFSQAYNHRFLTKSTNSLGYITTNSYDNSTGRVTKITDANGFSVTYTYDDIGKKIKEYSSKSGNSINYIHTWDTAGWSGLYSVVTYGNTTPISRVIYDKYTRQIGSYYHNMDNKIVISKNNYNSDGTLYQESLPYFNSDNPTPKYKTYTYDKYKRATKITSPSPSGSGDITTTFSYDGLKTTTTTNSQTTSTTQDPKGNTIKSIDANGVAVTHTYYADGKLKTTTTPDNKTISLSYDILGHKLVMNDPNMGEWVYDYNALGKVKSIVSPNESVSFYLYDKLGRLTEKFIRGYNYFYNYNNETVGKLGTLIHEAKSTKQAEIRYRKDYTYNTKAQLTSTKESIYINDILPLDIYNTKYSYYNNGKLQDLTYPNNLTIRHYYKNGYLHKIKDADTEKTLYQVDELSEFGSIAKATINNTLNQTYTYNQVGLQTNQYIPSLVDLTYSYNTKGLLKTKYDKYIGKIGEGLKEEYNYDNLNRLEEVQVTSSMLSNNEKLLNYTYSKSGNLKTKSDLNIRYKSDKPNQIDKLNNITYIYDNNGNLLKDDRHTFEYDPTDKVKTITQNGKTTRFDYSTSSQRYQKIYNKDTGYTHYIGKLYEKIRDDYTIGDRVEKNYIYFNSSLIAIKQRAVAHQIKEAKTQFTYKDTIGNIVAITNEDNTIVDRRSYKPYGEIRAMPYNEQLNHIPTLLERLKTTNRSFTGHEYIEDTDIIHMNGRVYDTITSRFTSADPFIQAPNNSQSYNRYSYVMGNPVNFTDPSGYNWFSKTWKNIKHGSASFYHDSREVVAVAASVAVIAMTAGTATPAVASAWSGFFGSYAIIASGAAAGAVSSGIMTGTVEGAAKGALWGGISAGVANGVADGVSAITGVDAHNASFLSSGFTEASVTKAIAHGLSRVAISELRYGTTKGAFLSGFVSSGFSVGKGASPEARTLVMAIVGGTASELGGGKFANGAMGSVFQYMFNDGLAKVNKYLTSATIKENSRVGGLSKDGFMEEFEELGFKDRDNINIVKLSLRRQFIGLAAKGIESDLFVPLPTSMPTGGKGFSLEAFKWLSPGVYTPSYNFSYSCTSSNCRLEGVYEK